MVYNWFEEKILIDGCEHIAYGLTANEKDEQIIIGDVTADKESIIALVDSFNRNELSTVHLEEAIEQFLYELKI